MAEVCTGMRYWELSESYYEKVIALDPQNAQAHFGLATTAVHRRDWQGAKEEALTAIGLHYHFAPAHYIAGLALWHCGEIDDAFTSLQNAVRINPLYPAAHRTLASFQFKEYNDWEAAARHRRLAREVRRRITLYEANGEVPDSDPTGSGQAISPITDEIDFENEDATADFAALDRSDTIIIATGLPRAGTSMLMQMLRAGGIPVLVDDHRPADPSNERGYLEFAGAKKLRAESDWLCQAKGHAVKIVAQLLPHLPQSYRYRVIMIHRPLPEIIASQKKMLQRLDKQGATITDKALMHTFQRQVAQVRIMLALLRKRGILDVLDLQYADAVRAPNEVSVRIAEFLGVPFDSGAAAAAVAPDLQHECS
ncbi:MAG: hypothetical protein R3F19_04245 [Verrucomicrobiales bacterium]